MSDPVTGETTPMDAGAWRRRALRAEKRADQWAEEAARVAAIFGVSRERIRQIEARALEKLRGEIEREEWRAAARRTG